MTDRTPAELDLADIETRAGSLYEYGTLADEPLQDDLDRLTGTDVPALTAALRRAHARIAELEGALAREERLHGDTIDDRDHFHDMADKLAYAVAPEEVIGEHSSMNCPWENALDLITPMAEVDKLRGELAAGRAQAWRALADRADPQRPEISFFGDHGHVVGEWMRQQAGYEGRAAAPCASSTARVGVLDASEAGR